jgi:hypothetical protein
VRAQPCPHPTAIIATGYYSYVEIATGYDASRGSISPQGDTLIGCDASPGPTEVLEPKSHRARGFSARGSDPRMEPVRPKSSNPSPSWARGFSARGSDANPSPTGLVDSQLYFFFHPSLGGECVY